MTKCNIQVACYVRDIVAFRGVAQLVGRVLWEHDVAGSSPVTPTGPMVLTQWNTTESPLASGKYHHIRRGIMAPWYKGEDTALSRLKCSVQVRQESLKLICHEETKENRSGFSPTTLLLGWFF